MFKRNRFDKIVRALEPNKVPEMSTPDKQSPGILDDYPVRKVIYAHQLLLNPGECKALQIGLTENAGVSKGIEITGTGGAPGIWYSDTSGNAYLLTATSQNTSVNVIDVALNPTSPSIASCAAFASNNQCSGATVVILNNGSGDCLIAKSSTHDEFRVLSGGSLIIEDPNNSYISLRSADRNKTLAINCNDAGTNITANFQPIEMKSYNGLTYYNFTGSDNELRIKNSDGKYASVQSVSGGILLLSGAKVLTPGDINCTGIISGAGIVSSGTISGASTLSISGSNLFVNMSGAVGIGTISPLTRLCVTELGIAPEASVTLSSDAYNRTLSLFGNGGAYFMGRDVTNNIEFNMGTSTSLYAFLSSATNHDLVIRTNNTEKIKILKEGGLKIINSAEPTTVAGSGMIFISGGAMFFKGGSGTVTNVAPA